MRPLKPLIISGREVLPLVEGGKGISISNGESSGPWAASGEGKSVGPKAASAAKYTHFLRKNPGVGMRK